MNYEKVIGLKRCFFVFAQIQRQDMKCHALQTPDSLRRLAVWLLGAQYQVHTVISIDIFYFFIYFLTEQINDPRENSP